MTRAYVGIGSSIEREANVRSAVRALRLHYGPIAVSPVYQSEAVGFAGDDFYNLVVRFDTERVPERLTAELHAIERAHGRCRSAGKFAPRTLDLDLLVWGDAVMERANISLPRKEILDYAFVLRPLADLAADELHPVTGASYGALWSSFDASGQRLQAVRLDLD